MSVLSKIGKWLAMAIGIASTNERLHIRKPSEINRDLNVRRTKLVVKTDRKAREAVEAKTMMAADEKRKRRAQRNIRNAYKWMPASTLPLPDAPLMLLMPDDLTIIEGHRKDYVAPSEKNGMLDFFDNEGNLMATGRFPWTYK